MGDDFSNIAGRICRATKSFCGVQGRFFQKKPLAAGGILLQNIQDYDILQFTNPDQII
jgi:hypothetical protein